MGLTTDTMAGADSKGVNGAAYTNGSPSSATAKHNVPSHFIGGSHLGAASPGKVKDFVAAHGGHTVITNVSNHSRVLVFHTKKETKKLIKTPIGAHREQRYCGGQGNQIGAEMGLRDLW
jgi:hypothetical protein